MNLNAQEYLSFVSRGGAILLEVEKSTTDQAKHGLRGTYSGNVKLEGLVVGVCCVEDALGIVAQGRLEPGPGCRSYGGYFGSCDHP